MLLSNILFICSIVLRNLFFFFCNTLPWWLYGRRTKRLSYVGDEMKVINKVSSQQYRLKLATSRAVLCMSGLGYDTYRLWETLALGYAFALSHVVCHTVLTFMGGQEHAGPREIHRFRPHVVETAGIFQRDLFIFARTHHTTVFPTHNTL